MSVDAKLLDPLTSRRAGVSTRNALCVTDVAPDLPPVGFKNVYTLYNKLLGSAGAVDGLEAASNMNVNGSATSQEFYVAAEADVDLRIMALVVIFADSAVAHSAFGNVSALTNGFNLQVFERGLTTNIIYEAKTGGQMIAQSGMSNAYGDGATSFELTNWTGTADAQTIFLPVASLLPGGIRIARGSEDKIYATVQDDLTGLTEFTVRAVGYRHHE